MIGRILRAFSIAVLILLACPLVRAEVRDGSLTSADRADDARLDRKVTINSDRILLGRLLDQLSAQTGVALRIDERDTLSGIPVLVVVKDIPLGVAMNALWSLLYFPGAPWHWEIEGRKGAYVYTLVPTFAAHNVAALLKEQGQAAYENAVKEMMRLAQLPPEDRKNHIRELSSALLQTDDNIARNWSGTDSFSENRWEGLRTLAESASPAQMAELLRGQSAITVSVDNMSDAGRAFVKHYVDRGLNQRANPDGSVSVGPDPREIRFATVGTQGADDHITPSLIVSLNNGGMSFVGGYALSNGFHSQLEARWLTLGDSPSGAGEGTQITRPDRAAPLAGDGDGFNNRWLTRGVLQIAQAAPLQTMALVADLQGADPGAPYGMTLKAYLAKLHTGRVIHKWRSGVLLLCNPWRLTDEDIKIPYRLLKNLSRSGVFGSRFLSLDELAELHTELSKSQMEKAHRQYALLEGTLRYAPLLAVCRQNKDIGKADGAVCTPDLMDALMKSVRLYPAHREYPGQATRVRLVSVDDIVASVPTRKTHIEFMTSDRKWKPITALQFIQVGTVATTDRLPRAPAN